MIKKVINSIRLIGLEAFCSQNNIMAVRDRQYPNLVLLKYKIGADFSQKTVRACRGLILDEETNWKIVSAPYPKFFNYFEKYASELNWNNAFAYEKIDGTMIQMYWYNGWRVGTTGTPDASGYLVNSRQTIAEWFWEIFRREGYELPPDNTRGKFTFLFELFGTQNRIIVKYKNDGIILHGIRYFAGPLQYEEATDISPLCMATKYPTPTNIPVYSIQEVVKMANSHSGEEFEGYVVVDDSFERIKVKNEEWMLLHKSGSSLKNRIAYALEHREKAVGTPEYEAIEYLANAANALNTNISDKLNLKNIALEYGHHPLIHAVLNFRRGKCASPADFIWSMAPGTILKIMKNPYWNENLKNILEGR